MPAPTVEAAAREGPLAPRSALRSFYFLYYAGVGVTLPYFSIYLKGLGLSGTALGTVQMLQPLLAAPAGLLWAALADRWHATTRVLQLSSLGVALAYLGLLLARGALGVGAVMVGVGLAGAAVVPLVDAVAVEWGKTQPGHSYPRTRLFGSLGYVFLAQGLGVALSARGDRAADLLVPLALFVCSAGYAAVSLALPQVPAPPRRVALAEALALLRDRRLLLLLAACALHWADCAPYHLLFGLFVRERGLPAWLTGLASALGVAAEVGVLWVAPALERRFSIRSLFAASFAATALRWALLDSCVQPAAIVGLQLLHGLTFGLFWATAVRAMAERVPPALRATGQALFSAVVFQLGNAVAFPLAGRGFDALGRVGPLYGWAAAIELVPLALVLLLRS